MVSSILFPSHSSLWTSLCWGCLLTGRLTFCLQRSLGCPQIPNDTHQIFFFFFLEISINDIYFDCLASVFIYLFIFTYSWVNDFTQSNHIFNRNSDVKWEQFCISIQQGQYHITIFPYAEYRPASSIGTVLCNPSSQPCVGLWYVIEEPTCHAVCFHFHIAQKTQIKLILYN